MVSLGHGLQVGRTEVVRSSLHPVFSKVFTVDYYFEEVQRLRFEVYDTHGPSGLSSQDDFLGGMECTLGQVSSTWGGRGWEGPGGSEAVGGRISVVEVLWSEPQWGPPQVLRGALPGFLP